MRDLLGEAPNDSVAVIDGVLDNERDIVPDIVVVVVDVAEPVLVGDSVADAVRDGDVVCDGEGVADGDESGTRTEILQLTRSAM